MDNTLKLNIQLTGRCNRCCVIFFFNFYNERIHRWLRIHATLSTFVKLNLRPLKMKKKKNNNYTCIYS